MLSRMARVLASFLRLSESHLQPYVIQAATVCDPGCTRVESRLQWGWGGVGVCVGGVAHLLLQLLPLARRRDDVDDVHEDGVEDRLVVVVVKVMGVAACRNAAAASLDIGLSGPSRRR